jgi:hypothetical protein
LYSLLYVLLSVSLVGSLRSWPALHTKGGADTALAASETLAPEGSLSVIFVLCFQFCCLFVLLPNLPLVFTALAET